MRTWISIVAALGLWLASCDNGGDTAITTDIVNNPNTASGEVDTSALPKIVFEEEVFDFGTITQGEKVKHLFKFTNTGKSDLIISSAKGSCGCTVPKWPKKPIPPGSGGEIDVVYNSEGRTGKQHKQVSVVANTQPSTTVVAIKGEVIAPDTDKSNNVTNQSD